MFLPRNKKIEIRKVFSAARVSDISSMSREAVKSNDSRGLFIFIASATDLRKKGILSLDSSCLD